MSVGSFSFERHSRFENKGIRIQMRGKLVAPGAQRREIEGTVATPVRSSSSASGWPAKSTHHAVTRMRYAGAIVRHAIHARDECLVFDGAGAQQRRPRVAAYRRPVGRNT